MFNNSKKIILIERIILTTVFLLILLTLTFSWGDNYFVGGDDGRLYYMYPYEYLTNFTTSIISENNLGGLGFYFPQMYIIPFSLAILFLRSISFNFINTQILLYILNLWGGFLGMYLLLGIFIKTYNLKEIFIKTIGSLMYILSTFTFISGWNNQLFAIYFIAVFPLVLVLFSKGIINNKYNFTVLASVFISVFSVLILSVPWALALIITSLPIILYLIILEPKIFIKHFTLFFLITFLLNVYWVYFFINSSVTSEKQSDLGYQLSSQEFINENKNTITSVSKNNSVLYPILNLPHYSIQQDFNWNTLPIYENWHLKFFCYNYIYLFIIIIPLIFYRDKLSKYKIYIYSIIIFLIILYLYTVNIGKDGINIFIFLSEKIPLFTLFRNMYDKFAIAISFIYSFLFAISLHIISKHKIFYKNILYILFILMILLNSLPFIKGDYFKTPIWTTQNMYPQISEYNEDFVSLYNFIKNKKDNNGKYLWFPLNKANYVFIQDKIKENNFYFGVSPLKILSNKNDFTGNLGFLLYNKGLEDKILNKDYEGILEFFSKMNVNYIIMYNELPEEIQNSYVFTYEFSSDLYIKQLEFKDKVLGEKIEDFGRYSIYNINEDYSYRKIHLSNKLNELSKEYENDIKYERINEGHYRISIYNLKSSKYLNFLDPYHELWKLSNDNLTLTSKSSLEYANSFYLDYEYIKRNSNGYTFNSDGSIDLKLDLVFEPVNYKFILYIISGTTLILCLVYLGYDFWKNRKRKLEQDKSNLVIQEPKKLENKPLKKNKKVKKV